MELLRSDKEVECYCALLHLKRNYIGPYYEGLYYLYKQNNFMQALNVLTILFPSLPQLTHREVFIQLFSPDIMAELNVLQQTYRPRLKRVAKIEKFDITRKIKSLDSLEKKMDTVLVYYCGPLPNYEVFIPLDINEFKDDIPISTLISSLHNTRKLISTRNNVWK